MFIDPVIGSTNSQMHEFEDERWRRKYTAVEETGEGPNIGRGGKRRRRNRTTKTRGEERRRNGKKKKKRGEKKIE